MTDYHKRPEWSYSQMKVILDHGIDYAVAAKRGMLSQPSSKAIDLGELAHMFMLGGNPKAFVVSPYVNFLTKEAKAWKALQLANGKHIIDWKQEDDFAKIVDNIAAHPMSKNLLKGKDTQYEIEMYATVNSVELRGKADALLRTEKGLIITDIKTTAQFDEWKYKARRRHYDLQAVIYSLIGSKSTGASPALTNFYFCVVETVAPFRVQYHHASPELLESGEQKLEKCLEAIKEFGDKEPNFLIEEVNELGDYSL